MTLIEQRKVAPAKSANDYEQKNDSLNSFVRFIDFIPDVNKNQELITLAQMLYIEQGAETLVAVAECLLRAKQLEKAFKSKTKNKTMIKVQITKDSFAEYLSFFVGNQADFKNKLYFCTKSKLNPDTTQMLQASIPQITTSNKTSVTKISYELLNKITDGESLISGDVDNDEVPEKKGKKFTISMQNSNLKLTETVQKRGGKKEMNVKKTRNKLKSVINDITHNTRQVAKVKNHLLLFIRSEKFHNQAHTLEEKRFMLKMFADSKKLYNEQQENSINAEMLRTKANILKKNVNKPALSKSRPQMNKKIELQKIIFDDSFLTARQKAKKNYLSTKQKAKIIEYYQDSVYFQQFKLQYKLEKMRICYKDLEHIKESSDKINRTIKRLTQDLDNHHEGLITQLAEIGVENGQRLVNENNTNLLEATKDLTVCGNILETLELKVNIFNNVIKSK